MKLFEFISAGPEAGDCTAPYDIRFNRECTVREFIDEVLKRNEWGYICINNYVNGPRCEYKYDKLLTPLSHAILDMPIKSATANGGWTRMDYVLDIWNAEQKLRFEYANTLREIVKHESEIAKLKKKAEDLENKLVSLDNDIPPHLDRDGCVYWDSVLVKEENDDEL